MDETTRQGLHEALRRRVCAVCLEHKDDGRCGLEAPRVCALEDHFARIVEVVAATDGRSLEERRQAIREQVCSECRLQDAGGRCRLRPRGECALDSYLPLVVAAIREVTGSPRSESPASAVGDS